MKTTTTRDDGESTHLFEPLLVSAEAKSRPKRTDLALTLAEKSAAFSSSLPSAIAGSLAEVVRIANCCYSSLLEGHTIRPIDIERATQGHVSDDVRTRAFELEARASISVARWIDEVGVDATPFSTGAVLELHRRLSGYRRNCIRRKPKRIHQGSSCVPGQPR